MEKLTSLPNPNEITCLLKHAKEENPKDTYDQLLPVVYDELLRIAEMRMMREQAGHTYSKTDLVHETYFQLIEVDKVSWKDRSHFFAVASHCMRRILIDHARKKKADKRGGRCEAETFIDGMVGAEQQADNLINLDDALNRLGELNERLAKVVECRYFGEMTITQTAEALEVSPCTVKRDWAKARGWLFKELKG